MHRRLQLARGLNLVLRFGLELTALYGLARLGQSLAVGSAPRLLWACLLETSATSPQELRQARDQRSSCGQTQELRHRSA